MAILSIINSSKHVAEDTKKLTSLTLKLQKTASSTGFIKKALHYEVIPKFAQIKGQFITKKDHWFCCHRILSSNLQKHVSTLKELTSTLYSMVITLQRLHGVFTTRFLLHKVRTVYKNRD